MSLGIIGSIRGKVLVSDGKRTKKINASATTNNVRANKREMLHNLILDAIAKFNYSVGYKFEGSSTLQQQMRNNRIRYSVLDYSFDYSETEKFYTKKRVVKQVKGKNRYFVVIRDKKTNKLKSVVRWKNKKEELSL